MGTCTYHSISIVAAETAASLSRLARSPQYSGADHRRFDRDPRIADRGHYGHHIKIGIVFRCADRHGLDTSTPPHRQAYFEGTNAPEKRLKSSKITVEINR